MTKKSLLSVRQIQEILNISRRTVYYWIKREILKPIRIGGVLRFHPEDIDLLIHSQRPAAAHRKKRILAVDDDILVRESLKSLLERAGFEVTVAASGKEAVELHANEVFELILTDIRMPEMNGIETLKAIRELRQRFGKAPLPEIILTAYDDPLVREEARALGVREFILKPFELEDFIAVIRRNLNHVRTRVEVTQP